MNEFLKIKWRANHPSELDSMLTFLDDEAISNSHIYKNFAKPITLKPEKPIESTSTAEPHVPGKSHFQRIRKRSVLTKREKLQCLRALKLLQSGKSQAIMTKLEKEALQVYNECQSKIVEENAQFLDFVKTLWERRQQQPPKMQPGLYKYAHNHWLNKIKQIRNYPQFYQQQSLISLNYSENEATITCNYIQNIAEMGTLARFSAPNLNEICQLKVASLPHLDVDKTSKLPVSLDRNIGAILDNHQIDVVVSSSGIQQILDNTDLNTKWNLPVVIKEITCGGNNTKRKVVFIDKALPKTNPNYHDLKKFVYKQLLRSNFCRYEALTFPNQDIPVEINPANTGTKTRKIHHNVSYRVWNIKKIGQSNSLMKNRTKDCDLNVLIRTKLDSCEMTDQGVLSPTILEPKIEQQIEFGANIATKHELIRCWSKLFFHPFSNLYRVRLVAKRPQVISVEKCTIQKITTEASTNYQLKPHLSLGVLQQILQELCELNVGNYILQHLPKHGAFAAIMKQSTENCAENIYNLYGDYENCKIDRKSHPEWLPIDVNYILPSHEDSDMIPAVFDGFDNKTTTKTNKKRKRRKKKQQLGGNPHVPDVL